VLVAGHESFQLSTSNDPVTQISWADGQTLHPATGELKGLLEVRDQVIPAQIAGLNQLAGSIISEVNTLHGDGYNMYGATDIAFFTGTTAGSMKVNPALSDPKMIATAAAAGDPGDGSVAKTIATLRTAPFAGLANSTAGSFYNTQVIRLGLEVQTATNLAKEHDVQLDALDGQRESIAGVNLDEEAANLVKAQRAYQAASRVITVLDEMLDQIINKMGLVGR
jgi:flagellar hook-associated protein 1 FlgK